MSDPTCPVCLGCGSVVIADEQMPCPNCIGTGVEPGDDE